MLAAITGNITGIPNPAHHISHLWKLNKGRNKNKSKQQVVVVQSLSRVWLFATPWTATRRASLSITNSWSLLKLMSIELVMPSNHLILCYPLLRLPSIFPSIRVFSNESAPCMRWSDCRSSSFSISPSNKYSGFYSSNTGVGWSCQLLKSSSQ